MDRDFAIEALRRCMEKDRMSEFYNQESLAEHHMLSYNELIFVFGKEVDLAYLPEVNRNLIHNHFVVQNAVHDQMWKYKFLPLVLRSLHCLSRIELSKGTQKAPSLVVHFGWVFGISFVFEPSFTYVIGAQRVFHSGRYFDYVFSKEISKIG